MSAAGVKTAEEIMAEIELSGVEDAPASESKTKSKDTGSFTLEEGEMVTVVTSEDAQLIPLGRFYKVSSRVGIAHLTLRLDDEGKVEALYTNRRLETKHVTAKEFLAKRSEGYWNLNARTESGEKPVAETEVQVEAPEAELVSA